MLKKSNEFKALIYTTCFYGYLAWAIPVFGDSGIR